MHVPTYIPLLVAALNERLIILPNTAKYHNMYYYVCI